MNIKTHSDLNVPRVSTVHKIPTNQYDRQNQQNRIALRNAAL